MFKNVVIKISGEALQGEKQPPQNASDACLVYPSFDDDTVNKLISEIIEVKNKGVCVSLVVGGGNIWRGRDAKECMDRSKADQIGMLATVMNALYLAEMFRAAGSEAVVMTPFVIGAFTEPFEKMKAAAYLQKGTILLFAGGTGLPFFSTDTIPAVRAAELGADAVLFAKNISGVYDVDPKTNQDAKKYDKLTYAEALQQNLRAIDITAMDICREMRLTSIVFGLNEPQGIIQAIFGTDEELYRIGTKITVE
jgi:uridylate kinase